MDFYKILTINLFCFHLIVAENVQIFPATEIRHLKLHHEVKKGELDDDISVIVETEADREIVSATFR